MLGNFEMELAYSVNIFVHNSSICVDSFVLSTTCCLSEYLLASHINDLQDKCKGKLRGYKKVDTDLLLLEHRLDQRTYHLDYKWLQKTLKLKVTR